MKQSIIVVTFMFVSSASAPVTLAWDDKVTHKDLSQYASKNSVLGNSNGNYLKNIGLDNGLEQYLKLGEDSKKIIKWFEKGGEAEDSWDWYTLITGSSRFVNHFHNPLKVWSEAGLSDIQSGESALLWSQDSARQQTFIKGDQTWSRAREFYRLALTTSTDASRQENFAQMFVAVGHQMHLVQEGKI